MQNSFFLVGTINNMIPINTLPFKKRFNSQIYNLQNYLQSYNHIQPPGVVDFFHCGRNYELSHMS